MSLKITPLAAESMGTRSMATFVESGKFRILIDPGVSIASKRYNLPPHPLEKWRREKHLERIRLFAESSQAIIITCFHSDHCSEELMDIYKNKMVFIQNPNDRLHANRRKSAFHFLKEIKGLPKDIIYMDNRIFEINDLRILFSKPIQCKHEENCDSVIPVSFSRGSDTFIFSSNIEGLYQKNLLHWMVQQEPTFLYLDGPVTFQSGHSSGLHSIPTFLNIMKQLFQKTPLKQILFDHHSLRDPEWKHKMQPFIYLAKEHSIKLQTAAEYRGEENNLLEARRKKLYEDEPVSLP